MNPFQCLEEALTKAMGFDSSTKGTLAYLSGSTPLSASVYTGFLRDTARDMADSGYDEVIVERYIMAAASAVSDWGLEPMLSKVTLNGTKYMLGKTINKNGVYWTIPLRRDNSTATSPTP